MTPAPISTTNDNDTFNIQGTILRKKNISSDLLKLALQVDNEEKSITVYIPRNDISTICVPSDFHYLYLTARIHVKGYVVRKSSAADTIANDTNNAINNNNDMIRIFNHVTSCTLLKCPNDNRLIREILSLPNYLSFSSTFNMTPTELRQLTTDYHATSVHDNKLLTKKYVVNTIIEKITGKVAKVPPKYRPGRVKHKDMKVLVEKELEGSSKRSTSSTSTAATTTAATTVTSSNGIGGQAVASWELCQPCQSTSSSSSTTSSSSSYPPPITKSKEALINLPTGAEHTMSHSGKLTRYEYLETKKNNQAAWFIRRIKQFEQQLQVQQGQKKQMRFLDVGGGRGDLAVTIALNYTESTVIVIDSNERSILAGREYAMKCGVNNRVTFVNMNFVDYMKQYEVLVRDDNNKKQEEVNFVVALHACGDLSDMALHFATIYHTNFIIAPCCYTKRYLKPFTPYWHTLCTDVNEVHTLSRLVELDDHREVSRRAMLVINSMRQSAFTKDDNDTDTKSSSNKGKKKIDVNLEEFDSKISKRNIALVGSIGSEL